MKCKWTIILLTVIVATASCSDWVEKPEDEASDINFSAPSLSTRGTVVNTPVALATAGGFNVWAYSHNAKWDTDPEKTVLMDQVTVTGTADEMVWNYGTPTYWPDNKYVSFFAYGPTASATPNAVQTAAQGVPVIDFTVATTVASQIDLLIASSIYDQRGLMYTAGNSVDLFFNHVLSRIQFSGIRVNETDSRTIKVKEISLSGLYNKGTVALTTPVAWTVDETATTAFTTNISTNTLSNFSLTNMTQELSTASGQLFLLPQQLAREAGKDPVMNVTLEIDGVELKYNSLLFSPGEWLPGKSYNYQIVVNGDDLEIIMIDSDLTLTEWNASIMVQPISLNNPKLASLTEPEDIAEEIADVKAKDEARIHSALKAFTFLNAKELADGIPNKVKYYAIYLRNDVNHNIEIDMTNYGGAAFTASEQIIFDAKKLIGSWGNNESNYYEFKVTYDPLIWKLVDSRQPVNLPFPPTGIDGITSATTKTSEGILPVNAIRHKGSIILERLP